MHHRGAAVGPLPTVVEFHEAVPFVGYPEWVRKMVPGVHNHSRARSGDSGSALYVENLQEAAAELPKEAAAAEASFAMQEACQMHFPNAPLTAGVN